MSELNSYKKFLNSQFYKIILIKHSIKYCNRQRLKGTGRCKLSSFWFLKFENWSTFWVHTILSPIISLIIYKFTINWSTWIYSFNMLNLKYHQCTIEQNSKGNLEKDKYFLKHLYQYHLKYWVEFIEIKLHEKIESRESMIMSSSTSDFDISIMNYPLILL
jgi:hypothetical protein